MYWTKINFSNHIKHLQIREDENLLEIWQNNCIFKLTHSKYEIMEHIQRITKDCQENISFILNWQRNQIHSTDLKFKAKIYV